MWRSIDWWGCLQTLVFAEEDVYGVDNNEDHKHARKKRLDDDNTNACDRLCECAAGYLVSEEEDAKDWYDADENNANVENVAGFGLKWASEDEKHEEDGLASKLSNDLHHPVVDCNGDNGRLDAK